MRAVLADPRYVPVPAGAGGAVGSMAWLRSAVARFSHGPDHARRRAIVEAELAAIDPERLRAAAAREAHPVGEAAAGEGLPARGARPADQIAVAVLAEALGVGDVDGVVGSVPAVATVYLSPGDDAAERAADSAVAVLVKLLGGEPDERVANRIGLLVQAYAATAGLVRAAVARGSVADGLRDEPPVRSTRRVATVDTSLAAAGDTLVLDLAAAGMPFGGEPRVCPGREHALAIARGVAR